MSEKPNPLKETHLRIMSSEEVNLPPIPMEEIASFLRARRNELLAQSDIYVLPDRWESYSAETRAAWSAYRQALRDLPETFKDSSDPIWPERPE